MRASACRRYRTSCASWKSRAATRGLPSGRNFREGVEKLEDLEPGMLLEGVVTNVAAFGAFVDIGVHQDGLVHISADVEDLRQGPAGRWPKPGDIVRVKVLDVDPPDRRRIALDDASR